MTYEKYSYMIKLNERRGTKKLQQYTLKELRARKNMTQYEVAKNIGISTQTYNAWERDVSNVAISKVKALADLFEVTIGEIFLP